MSVTSPSRTRAIRIEQPGGPDAMHLVEVPIGDPGPGEIRIRHRACGLNFIDVYQREGIYPTPTPFMLGREGAGVVLAVFVYIVALSTFQLFSNKPPGFTP